MANKIFSGPSNDSILIRPASCSEVDSIKKFSFSGNSGYSGNFNKNGNLSGKGILRIDDESLEQNFCIKVKNLFGLQIASIESDFVDGLANKKTFIELKHGVKNDGVGRLIE